MTTSVDSESNSSTLVNDSRPWVDAKVVSEFAYCPRAGIICHEQYSLPKEIVQRPNLDFLPQYSLIELERALAQLLTPVIWRCVGVAASIVMAVVVSLVTSATWLLIPIGLLVLVQGITIGRPLRQIALLRFRHRQALAAEPKAPEAESSTRQNVNWWNLLKVGFISVPYREELRDASLRLSGLPWRVLRYGSLRLPVFKYVAPPLEPIPTSTELQQTTLASAYCHLLETCEAMESPYSIVLLGETYDGLTLPQSDESRAMLCATVKSAQSHIAALSRVVPNPPNTNSPCETCRHGMPRAFRVGMMPYSHGGMLLRVRGKRASDGRLYHSLCGDRFRWIPPHKRAIELGLPVDSVNDVNG